MTKQKILIADDEAQIREILRIYFEKEDFDVIEAEDGADAILKVQSEKPDILLLDIMMPVLDGIEVCKQVRKMSDLPIIMVTAKDDDDDRIAGLEIGADDYITKPFNPVEVLARVRSQLRRYTLLGARAGSEEAGVYTVGNVSLNEETKRVTVDGETVTLTPLEYNILHLLIRSPGRIYSSAQIYEAVWNEDSLGAETSVAVHIRHLRQKIEINPSDPRYLKVVWGLGYKMEDGEK